MSPRVLLTGATGFTGSHVLSRLLQRGWSMRCFVRPSSDVQGLPTAQVELAYGDLEDASSLQRALAGVDILVNVASLGFGHAPTIVHTAESAGDLRAVFLSTTGIFTQLNPASKAVRLSAETCIRQSRLRWTILRPTMIYGTSRDRNLCRLARYLQRWPAIPILGSGEFLQQPVYVEDLAYAVTEVVDCAVALGKAYNISGANALTYNHVVDTVSDLLGRRVRKLHLPARPVARLLAWSARCGLPLPIKAEQIWRLNDHKAFDHLDAQRDFGYRPRSFRAGMLEEVRAMGLVPARGLARVGAS